MYPTQKTYQQRVLVRERVRTLVCDSGADRSIPTEWLQIREVIKQRIIQHAYNKFGRLDLASHIGHDRLVVTDYFCDTKEIKKMQSAQMETKFLRCEERVRVLEEVVKQQSNALKESSKLLQKSRPQRPAIPHDRKLA